MTKLRKFRTLEDKIILGLKIFCCLLILTIIVMGKSLAEYKQEAEVTFIRARVGKFTANDIKLAMKVDGEEVETPPSKDNYTVDISCDNADGSWDYDRWAAVVGNITAGKVKCEVNFSTPAPTLSEVTATSEKTSIALSYTVTGTNASTTCKWGTTEGTYDNEVEGATNTNCNISSLDMDTLYYYQVCAKNGGGESCKTGSIKTKPEAPQLSELKLGDYVKMTPTSTSYTPQSSLTGFTGNVQNALNPSELNLWRVISLNEDGTVDMVSEYVSSQKVYFQGKTGYINYIKVLNEIAAQYTDGKHVARTRHIGYSNQTETLTDTSKLSQTTAPWTKHTDGNSWTSCNTSSYLCGTDESKGAGDRGFEKDYNLVKNVYGNMIGKNPSGSAQYYWLASRLFYYINSTHWNFDGRRVSTGGSLDNHQLYYYSSGFNDYINAYAVRPIVTLKSDTNISGGSGSSSDPYTLL